MYVRLKLHLQGVRDALGLGLGIGLCVGFGFLVWVRVGCRGIVRNSVRIRGRGSGINKTISNRTNIESRRMFASRMSVSTVYWRMAAYKG
jgi:hypothetical protein